MHITKYQHACIALEVKGQKLIIDPGIYTPTFGSIDNIAAVVITHKHADHFSPEHIKRIIAHNPNASIFSVEQVTSILKESNAITVRDGDEQVAGPFSLSFMGHMHAEVHPDWPTTVQNIGVCVNNSFYYAGDSLTLPNKPLEVLAIPVSYAWVKMSEAMDFVAAVKPTTCFLTHNNPLSEAGSDTAASWLTKVCQKHAINFQYLMPGEFLDIKENRPERRSE